MAIPRRALLQALLCLPLLQRAQAESLNILDSEFRSGKYPGVDGMLLLQNGRPLYAAHYPPARPTPRGAPGQYNYSDPDWHPLHNGLHTLQSITKTVLSALVGIALRRGQLPSLEQKVESYFPGKIDPELRLRHLLSMESNIAWNEDGPYDDPLNDWAALERSPDWVAYVLSRPRVPTRFYYNSGIPILIAAILTQATGQSIENYCREQLFEPLAIDDYYWKITPTGLADTQGGLYLKIEDLAKIGQLYLQQGAWHNERIFSPSWAQESFLPRNSDNDWKYGYQWWLLPYAGRWIPTALGYGGQRLFLFPERKLVAVLTGWNPGGQNSLPLEKALQILGSGR